MEDGSSNTSKIDIPKWLDERFVKTVFKSGKTIDCKVENALGGAEFSQCSEMYRVKLDVRSVIVKMLKQGIRRPMMDEMELMDTEVTVYREVLTKAEAMGVRVAPRSFDLGDDILVLEDLTAQGYRTQDRRAMLDWHHSAAVVRSLAKYHAASHLLLQAHPRAFLNIRSNKMLHSAKYRALYTSVLTAAAEAIKVWPEVAQYSERLRTHAAHSWEKITTEFLRTPLINVLIHGDVHCCNIMFRPGSTEPRLVDFALGCEGSPAWDLVFFLQVSAADEVRTRQRELLDVYAEAFNQVMSTRSDLRLSGHQLEEEMSKFPYWAYHEALTRGAIILGEEGIDMNALMAKNDFRSLFESRYSKKRIIETILKSVELGLF